MEKILFYSNEWSDFKEFVKIFPKLEAEGIEVAVGSHDSNLIHWLSVGKLLVVSPKSYYDDATIVMDGRIKLPGKNCHYYSELLGAFQ
jgi:hypothetical protein